MESCWVFTCQNFHHVNLWGIRVIPRGLCASGRKKLRRNPGAKTKPGRRNRCFHNQEFGTAVFIELPKFHLQENVATMVRGRESVGREAAQQSGTVERWTIIPSHQEILWSRQKGGNAGVKKGRCPPTFFPIFFPPLFLPPFSSLDLILLSSQDSSSSTSILDHQSSWLTPPPSSSRSPPEGQLNVRALSWATRPRRMVCDNGLASRKEKQEGARERHHVLSNSTASFSLHFSYRAMKDGGNVP